MRFEEMTPEEARADFLSQAESFAALFGPERPVARVENRTIPGGAGPIPVRVYWPETGVKLPVLVYYHGGGLVFGTLDSTDRICRTLAADGRVIVVSVDYRLAPEHKFPAAADDSYAAYEHVLSNAGELDAGGAPIAVGGDSAGGNLAAVTCLMARDRQRPLPSFQLLVYPVTDYEDDRPSMREFADGHLLTGRAMDWFWGHYVASGEQGRHPYASPLRAESLDGLPPALVITAECDVLRDQGEAYGLRLIEAGVPTEIKRYEGAIHAFFQMGAAIDSGREALADAAAALRRALHGEGRSA